MEQLMRAFFLYLSNSLFFTKVAKKYGLKFGASRFVAGETLEQTIEVIKELNSRGLTVTIDYLGEFIRSEQEARERTEECLKAIELIKKSNVEAQISLKLTSMGLDISEDILMENLRMILRLAKKYNIFITIDMEDYKRCERTLSIFKELRQEFNNLGTVLQAYLYRSIKDVEELNQLKPNLRLVKGAYKESLEVAFPNKADVDENFKELIKLHLLNGNYTAVATHDDQIIEYTKKLVEEYQISNDKFEFQMLYGIRTERQFELVEDGYNMRVYVPYGKDWYGYFMRRLAERPANVAFVLKGVLKK